MWNNSAYRPIETTPFFNASLPVEKHLARAGLTFPRMFPQKVGLKLHTWERDVFSLRSVIGLKLMLFCSQSKIRVVLPGKSARARCAAET